MSKNTGKRVVAELGRPETPEETASRKAANTAAYRSSKTFRNLLVALGVTLLVVLVIVFAVPRGTSTADKTIDVAAAAQAAEVSFERAVIQPQIPADWLVNQAGITREAGNPAWEITAVPPGKDDGFIRIAQAFDTDSAWASRRLGGITPSGQVELDGRTWDQFAISRPAENGNIARGTGTQIGSDYLLLYGTYSAATLEQLMISLNPAIEALKVNQ